MTLHPMGTEALPASAPKASSQERELVKKFLSANAGFLEPDQDIMRDHRMSPRSVREESALSQLDDPHLFREIGARLTAILDESFEISEQTVAAPAGKFADLATAYMTAAGDISLLSNRGVAAFATVLHYPVKFVIKYFSDDPSVEVNEGDAFLANDARYGGVHSPDQGMMMPVFYKGELVAWTICAMHEGEIGARPPGGMGPTIESPYEEGFRGSPIKIADNFTLKTDLVTLLQNSCREPLTMLVDLRARLATCIRLQERLLGAIDEYGVDAVVGALRRNPEFVAEEAARRIEEMPDGKVSANLYSDSTMREPALVKCNVSLEVRGNRMVMDLRGSAPEIANRPINTPIAGSKTGVMMALITFIWPDLPKSPAVLENVDFITDPESLFDCSYDVPIALNMHCFFKVITATELLISKLIYSLPNRYSTIKAPWFNQPAGMMYGGDTQHGNSVGNVCADINGMGGGARCHRDGEHSIAPNFATMVDTGETELQEENLPYINFVSKRMEADAGSFGKYRGGHGYQMMYVRYGGQPFGFQAIAGGSKFPSTVGLSGGYGCATYCIGKIKGVNLFEVLRDTPELFVGSMSHLMNHRPFPGATYETVPSSMDFELAYEGEIYMISQGAGGGYGDVLERDPELVMTDVEDGLISHETARELYCVVYNEETLVVDAEATEQRRDGERRSRLQRGKPYHEFVNETVRGLPPSGILYFGNWNGSEKLFAGPVSALPGNFPTDIYLPDPKDIVDVLLHSKLVTSSLHDETSGGPALSAPLASIFHPRTFTRLAYIMGLAGVANFKAMFALLKSRFVSKAKRKATLLKDLGRVLATFLHKGGPTFIKLGQVLSTRPDLLSEDLIAQLSYLQDEVPPMPFSVVRQTIEDDFGKPLEEIYRDFNEESIAAGSVAQVHEARLSDGTRVAVKVKRPNLEEQFESDLRVFAVLVRLAHLVPGVKNVRPLALIDEFGGAIRSQMDFGLERRNNLLLAKNFERLDWVRLPALYEELSGDNVITMEFIDGHKVSEHMRLRGGERDRELAERLYSLYMDMAFNSQLLHADLHGGNLLIDQDRCLVLLDTGLVHSLPSYYARRYIRAYLCVSAADGWLQTDNYFSGRTHLIDPAKRRAFAEDLHACYQGWDERRDSDFTIMWIQVLDVLRKHDVTLDREFMMMMVADMTMAGMAKQFDPSFDVVEKLRQELPNLIFHEKKLALNDPYLLAAMRSDLLKKLRAATALS